MHDVEELVHLAPVRRLPVPHRDAYNVHAQVPGDGDVVLDALLGPEVDDRRRPLGGQLAVALRGGRRTARQAVVDDLEVLDALDVDRRRGGGRVAGPGGHGVDGQVPDHHEAGEDGQALQQHPAR
jgi:hypothetical protein